MKWSNLKINKCPQCEKDWSMSLREEKSGAFGLKLLIHDCGFKIYERRYREIVMDMLNKNKDTGGGRMKTRRNQTLPKGRR